MRVPFIKMHGLGNDFVIIDRRQARLPHLNAGIRSALADRQTGIGCDQLILLEESTLADVRMRIFNPDGIEASACGNATRAIGVLEGTAVTIETKGGVISAEPEHGGISVDMGTPAFEWDRIPLAYTMDTTAMPVTWGDLPSPDVVNVGNPHIVFFVNDVGAVPLAELGPQIEQDDLFPDRINVNIAEVTGQQTLTLRVWERGAGVTRACGTGACASAVAALRRKLVASPVAVSLPGGVLSVAWDGCGSVVMNGPAAEAFRGSFELEDYA